MLEYKGYQADVQYDPESKVLHGTILGISDVVAFEYKLKPEVSEGIGEAFRRCVDEYHGFCTKHDVRLQVPKIKQSSFSLHPKLRINILKAADHADKSTNQWIEDSLAKTLDDMYEIQENPFKSPFTLDSAAARTSHLMNSKGASKFAHSIAKLKELAMAIREIKPYLRGDEPDELCQLVERLDEMLQPHSLSNEATIGRSEAKR